MQSNTSLNSSERCQAPRASMTLFNSFSLSGSIGIECEILESSCSRFDGWIDDDFGVWVVGSGLAWIPWDYLPKLKISLGTSEGNWSKSLRWPGWVLCRQKSCVVGLWLWCNCAWTSRLMEKRFFEVKWFVCEPMSGCMVSSSRRGLALGVAYGANLHLRECKEWKVRLKMKPSLLKWSSYIVVYGLHLNECRKNWLETPVQWLLSTLGWVVLNFPF